MILFRWRLLCLAVLFLPASIFAQSQTITLEQAVELTKQNSLQLELFRQEKLQKQGEAMQSSVWPNPQFRVSREQLNRGTIDYNETTIQISQPVEILGQSFLRNRRSSHIEYAAELEFRYSGDLLKERVRMLYAEYWKTKNIVRAYDETLDVIKTLMESARARQAEGTFSGLDAQRFTIEFNRYNLLRNELETEARQLKQELISLIQPNAENPQNIEFADSFSIEPLPLEKEELIQYATSNRADLNALERQREANELRYKIEKRNRIPALNLDFGYKNQSDGSEGFVFGGSVTIPLFNQNRGNITEARAGTRSAETSVQIQRQVIQNQIEVTVQTVEILYRQWEQIEQNPDTESMLKTAESAYQDGRYSLIELLDAAKAWLDDRTNRINTISDYNKALFELDRMTSGIILSTQNHSDQ
jgi:outer membrane protein, heavy metal efflux system